MRTCLHLQSKYIDVSAVNRCDNWATSGDKNDIQYLLFRYSDLLKVQVPGREIPADAQDRVAEILPR